MARALTAVALAALLAVSARAASPGWTTVSGPTPFGGCASGGLDGLFAGAEVEPSLAVDPSDPKRLIAAWQQDRYSTGAARGLVAATSGDGGRTWQRVTLPFSLCAGGQTTGWGRASDPWVSVGPDGWVYAISIGNGIAVSTSGDHGRNWRAPTLLARNDSTYITDKPTITADPAARGVAYAVWQRYLVRSDGPPIESDTLLSVTRDDGRHWSSPSLVLAHGHDDGDVASVILPDPARHRLFHLSYRQAGGVPGPGPAHLSQIVVQRSTDGGKTWSAATQVTRIHTVGGRLRDPASGKIIRPGVASFALDRGSGALYATWQDSRFGSGAVDQVAFSRSTDGGRTWTKPRRLDTGTGIGLMPTVAAEHGTVAVSYYAVRAAKTPARGNAQAMLAVSKDGGKTFRRRPLGTPFTMGDAPLLAGDPSILVPPGLFLGDYSGLAVDHGTAYALLATANPARANPTDVRFAAVSAR